ncbi:hypothetical protein BDV18DRAFT_126599 [Aspergillus unguis]
MKPAILLLSLAALATAAPTDSDLFPTLGDPAAGLLFDGGGGDGGDGGRSLGLGGSGPGFKRSGGGHGLRGRDEDDEDAAPSGDELGDLDDDVDDTLSQFYYGEEDEDDD